MARILVADDNSNVHKTVALALADLGAEILGVNNGEAAVRKLADFRPDLILADIFMPVRSGYEVCEFVKNDAKFSRVPVILLLGAFDPFDARESERVRADGTLKKPFVPPDALIAMVKELLDRSEHRQPVLASVPTGAARTATDSGEKASHPAHLFSSGGSPEETQVDEIPVTPARMIFGDNASPAAFEALLQAPSLDLETAPVDLGEPAAEPSFAQFEGAAIPEPALWPAITASPLQASADAASTMVDTGKDPLLEVSPTPELAHHSAPYESEIPAAIEPAEVAIEPDEMAIDPSADEPIELVRDEQNHTLSGLLDTAPVSLDPASQSSLSVEPGPASDLSTSPIEWMESAPELHAVSQPQISEPPSADASGSPQESSPGPASLSPEVPGGLPLEVAVEDLSVEEVAVELVTPRSDWAEIHAAINMATPAQALEAEVAREAANALRPPVEPAPHVPAPRSAPDPALVDVIVQRVVDKMRPQVVDIITTEFLRPLVQVLVQREIEKL